MKYPHLTAMLYAELWAIEAWKLEELRGVLEFYSNADPRDMAALEAKLPKTIERETASKRGKVGLLPIRGTIANRFNMMSSVSGGSSAEVLSRDFSAMMRDDDIKAVVLDVDSPGGTVAGTDELSAQIAGARGVKPIVAHVNGRAASAAYWIATAADEVVMSPSAMAGSIGILTAHDDLSKAMESRGVKTTLIHAGKYKVEGNPFGPLSDEAREHIQASVDKAHGHFINRVASNRHVSKKTVAEDFGQGRMFDADTSVSLGMADQIATLEQTLNRFGATSHQPVAQARAFPFEREKRALAFNT